MLPSTTIAALARQLYEARKTRTQLRHFSKAHPTMTVEDGYAIQREWVRLEIADGRIEASYVHAALKVGTGRSEQTRRATGDALFEVMKAHFAAHYERMGLALSLEVGEFSEAGTWKHNNLHARFRKG